MKRIIMMLTLAAMLVVALSVTAPTSFAAKCPDGTQATNEPGGIKSCETIDYAGQSDNFFVEEESVKGSFQTKHEVTEECKSNPGGQPHGCH